MPARARPGRVERVLWLCAAALALQAWPAAAQAPAIGVVRGSVASASASCGGGDSPAVVAAVGEGPLGPAFGSQAVACAFLPWALLQQANVTGALSLGASSASAPQLAGLLQAVLQAPASNASLSPMVFLQHGSNASSSSFAAKCTLPAAAAEGQLAVVLYTNETADKGAGTLALVLPQRPLDRMAITGVAPLLGPSTGGTQLSIEGLGLRQPLACLFARLHAPGASVTVPANVTSPNSAACVTPAWALEGFAASEALVLTVSAAGCSSPWPYRAFRPPAVLQAQPGRLPRFGSFRVAALLNASLAELAGGEEELLQPALRISRAFPNGSDLLLPANLTADGTGLEATAPGDLGALAAGNRTLAASLDGRSFSGNASVRLEGPLLAMAQPHIAASAADASGSLTVTALLDAPATLPVTAQLALSLRTEGGSSGSSDGGSSGSPQPAPALSSARLAWAVGEAGERSVQLALGGAAALLGRGALLVRLEGGSNADVLASNASTAVSGLSVAQLAVGFAVQPNQVAFRGDSASIPISITNAPLRTPAAVAYSLATLDGSLPAYLPPEAAQGLLLWDAQAGERLALPLPIQWASVSAETEDHLVLSLTPLWSARVPPQQQPQQQQPTVALHVFGVQRGQCPPGTFRFDGAGGPAALLAPQPPPPAPAQQPASGSGSGSGWLRSIAVAADGWAFDLSQKFRPDVPEYGVIVPPGAAAAQLCLQPYQEGARVSVSDGQGRALAEALPPAGGGPTMTAASIAFAAAGRKLQATAAAAKSVAVTPPSEAPAAAAAGVQPLGKRKLPGSAAACGGRAWALPLAAGQNQFSIAVEPPLPPGGQAWLQKLPASGSAPPPAAGGGSSSGGSSYTLSVVRLADPAHAQLDSLNVTAADASYAVCGEGGWGDEDAPPCQPGAALPLNVSAEAEWVGVHPGLRFPGVPGLRVEVAGQVLSQGGNVGADQLADTTDQDAPRNNADFLPVALVVGLPHGTPVEVPIVVVAEDGVTSLRYYVHVTRGGPPSDAPEPAVAAAPALGGGSDGGLGGASVSLAAGGGGRLEAVPPPPVLPATETGWPTAPADEPWCNVCPAGWATAAPDQPQCGMCLPGSFAPRPRSPGCSACEAGTHASSWGSSHCAHCIVGTYAPHEGSRLCLMCPENMTNLEDGSAACPLPLQPGTNLTMRYAVIVSFGVFLNGTSLDEIAAKVGVNASAQLILRRLVSGDTAAAFNTTARDVNVTAITQVSRRVLLLNVTATLGVDLPANSSADAVAAQLAVKNLSADDAIDMLAQQPDKFLGRTTKALDVTAEPGGAPPTRTESHPPGVDGRDLLPWYAILLLCGGALAILGGGAFAWRRHRRQRLWRARRLTEAGPGVDVTRDATADAARPASGRLTARQRAADREPLSQAPDSAAAS